MLSNKIVKLVRRLFQLTQEEKLPWEETGHESVYQLSLADYIIRVAEQPQEDPKQPPRHVLRICNAKGIVLDQVTDEDINEHIHDAHEFLQDLYRRARRIAMGVETAIDRINRHLDEKRASS